MCDIDGTCIDTNSICNDKISYGPKCNKPCNENCQECNRNGECTSCKDNHKWDISCNKQCSNCPDGTCDITGICIDQTSNCQGNDYYGNKCDQLCISINENCVECNRDETCISCNENKYSGNECQTLCSSCPGGKCNIDGTCLISASDICSDEKKWGDACNVDCNNDHPKCEKCFKINGECFECDEGFYGINCDQECSNCPGKKCDIGGKCIGLGQTCIENTKTGDYCTTPCSNVITFCLQCTRDLKCQNCESYYYR